MEGTSGGTASGRKFKLSLDNNYIFLALAIAIMAVLIYMRTGLLVYQGMFEPDGFFYYTALKQIVASGFSIIPMPSMHVLLSGYPWHNTFNEAPGVLWATLIPYFFLRFFGVSLLTVMRSVPILFGVFNRVRKEEQALLRSPVGSEYAAYCAGTKRFIPGLI